MTPMAIVASETQPGRRQLIESPPGVVLPVGALLYTEAQLQQALVEQRARFMALHGRARAELDACQRALRFGALDGQDREMLQRFTGGSIFEVI